jgi:hypothetical protein
MLIIQYLIAMQVIGDQGRSIDINGSSAEIIVIALFALMFGLMALVFVRTGSKRSRRH